MGAHLNSSWKYLTSRYRFILLMILLISALLSALYVAYAHFDYLRSYLTGPYLLIGLMSVLVVAYKTAGHSSDSRSKWIRSFLGAPSFDKYEESRSDVWERYVGKLAKYPKPPIDSQDRALNYAQRLLDQQVVKASGLLAFSGLLIVAAKLSYIPEGSELENPAELILNSIALNFVFASILWSLWVLIVRWGKGNQFKSIYEDYLRTASLVHTQWIAIRISLYCDAAAILSIVVLGFLLSGNSKPSASALFMSIDYLNSPASEHKNVTPAFDLDCGPDAKPYYVGPFASDTLGLETPPQIKHDHDIDPTGALDLHDAKYTFDEILSVHAERDLTGFILIGAADRQALNAGDLKRFGSNEGLAQQRAVIVKNQFSKLLGEQKFSNLRAVITLNVGPIQPDIMKYELDRTVRVCAVLQKK